MYGETFERLDDPRLREVVRDKVTVMYGPPMVQPDLALVSFQRGAGDRTRSARSWPDRLLYLDGHFDFGRTLRRQCSLGSDESSSSVSPDSKARYSLKREVGAETGGGAGAASR